MTFACPLYSRTQAFPYRVTGSRYYLPANMSTPDSHVWKLSMSWHASGKHQQQNKDEAERERQMQLTLQDLERTTDPMVAAQLYNDKHTPLSRIPDEILLQIIGYCIDEDSVANLYCLRRVSKRLRRVLDEPTLWEGIPAVRPTTCAFNSERNLRLSHDQRQKLRQRLQKDSMCNRCRAWSDLRAEDYPRLFIHGDILQAHSYWSRAFPSCKFDSGNYPGIYCDGCGADHDAASFRPPSMCSGPERVCLGRQGGVQLCEHIHVYWGDIESHITSWRKRGDWDFWKACLDDFRVECRDPSHDMRCRAEDAPTWPRARLRAHEWNDALAVLTIEWKPHSGLDAFTLTPCGRLPAPELRALFRRYREGAAKVLLPPRPSSHYLPEMECFAAAKSSCVAYKGSNALGNTMPLQNSGHRCDDDCWTSSKPHGHNALFYGKEHTSVDVSKHRRVGDSICLTTTYRFEVKVFRKTDDKINPSHDWFHAMDPCSTYRAPCPDYQLPLCDDGSCMNYYRRRRAYHCPVSHSPTHRLPCLFPGCPLSVTEEGG